MGLISRVSSRTYRFKTLKKLIKMYKQPEQTYSSIYSDAPKSEEKTTASYGYQQAAGQTAEAYYAQQEAISIMQQQQQEYEKQAAAYKRRERSRSPEVKRRER